MISVCYIPEICAFWNSSKDMLKQNEQTVEMSDLSEKLNGKSITLSVDDDGKVSLYVEGEEIIPSDENEAIVRSALVEQFASPTGVEAVVHREGKERKVRFDLESEKLGERLHEFRAVVKDAATQEELGYVMFDFFSNGTWDLANKWNSPSARGFHLSTTASSLMAEMLIEKGFSSFESTIDEHNFPSLKAQFKMQGIIWPGFYENEVEKNVKGSFTVKTLLQKENMREVPQEYIEQEAVPL
jgi:hypothetical protein